MNDKGEANFSEYKAIQSLQCHAACQLICAGETLSSNFNKINWLSRYF